MVVGRGSKSSEEAAGVDEGKGIRRATMKSSCCWIEGLEEALFRRDQVRPPGDGVSLGWMKERRGRE